MTGLAVFERDGWSVRSLLIDDEPWFVARDVCQALGITNNRDAVARLDADGVGTTDVIDSMGRTQTATIVNEAGLYELIFVSRREEAKAFKRWVTHDVLPQIRRTGSYGHPSRFEIPSTLADALQLAADQARQLEVAAPKVAAHDALLATTGDLAVREAAQMLARDYGIDIGQNRLFKFMREIGWLDRNGIPYQRVVDNGRLAVKALTYEHPHTGEPKVTTQVRVTPKGLTDLHARLTTETPVLQLHQGGAS